MATLHLIVGVAVLATNLAAGAIGAIAWLRKRPSVGFWYVLRTAQATVVAPGPAGGDPASSPATKRPTTSTTSTASCRCSSRCWRRRRAPGAAERELEGVDFDSLPIDRQRPFALAIVRRETGIMAVSALVVFGLALRAAGTSGALF